jgi:hypothetical protein
LGFGRKRGCKMKSRKSIKVEKWKNVKIPESLWRTIKIEAAKQGKKIYEVIKV